MSENESATHDKLYSKYSQEVELSSNLLRKFRGIHGWERIQGYLSTRVGSYKVAK